MNFDLGSALWVLGVLAVPFGGYFIFSGIEGKRTARRVESEVSESNASPNGDVGLGKRAEDLARGNVDLGIKRGLRNTGSWLK